MNFRSLDLNLLVALDALLTERNVTRAGERIFRSQSAMSGILSRLRQFFHDDLLIRIGNQIELTPVAEQLIEPIQEFISLAQRISDFKPTIDPSRLEQVFVFAMSDYCADFVMPRLTSALSREAPSVRVRVRTVDYDYWGSLERRETDFVVLPEEAVVGHGAYAVLLEDRWVCIADAARYAGSSISVEEFMRVPFVSVNYDDGRTQMAYQRQLSSVGLTYKSVLTVPYFQMLPRLIAGSDNLAVIHERTAMRDASAFGIKILEIPLPMLPIRLCATMHERNSFSKSHLWFRSVLLESCHDLRRSGESVSWIRETIE